METVKVSPKYQVVIPKTIRESFKIVSGEKMQVIAYNNRIELIPIGPMKKLKGFLKGMNTNVKREKTK